MRRIFIAPDKFKGSLTAPQAATALAEGVKELHPAAELDLCPIADGGEGFMETLAVALDGRWVTCRAVDALGRPIDSRYVLAETVDGPVAILEMAETAGIWRLAAGELDPLGATTRGVGMQMVDAITEHRVARIILGLGGSATNDGGCGMAAATGIRFLDGAGREVDPLPRNLTKVRRIEREEQLGLTEITAACDVDNPLLGERGATAVFSAQKGAGEEDRVILESALAHLTVTAGASIAAETLGAGAAGGLGFGLLRFANATLVPGFELIAGLLELESRISTAELVLTGEGSLDAQSLSGKGPVALARLAKEKGVPVIGFCGNADQAVRQSGLFDSIHSLADSGLSHEILMEQAAPLLRQAVVDSGRARG